MNQENAIEVCNLKKTFKVYADKGHTLKEKTLSKKRNQYETHEVLKGISFNVKKGEAIGLVGHNGCGKSTTLKLLSRIMYPDSGEIKIQGRVSSLLELGAGFHQDLSGRENIYINASIFGIDRKETEQRIDDIIAFSELEEFIDNPVRTYSSGMYMRLAFSVAINVNADILLIDEILAVGDINFQTKCFNKMMEIKGKGTTLVFVSHSTDQVERICDRSIWIDNGMIKADGIPIDVHRQYLDHMREQRNTLECKETEKESKKNIEKIENTSKLENRIELISAEIKDITGNRRKIFGLHDRVDLEFEAEAKEKINDYFIEINLVRADGLFCYGCATNVDRIPNNEWMGTRKITVSFDEMELLTGKYHFDIHFANGDRSTILFCGNVAEFEIDSDHAERGISYLKHSWVEE